MSAATFTQRALDLLRGRYVPAATLAVSLVAAGSIAVGITSGGSASDALASANTSSGSAARPAAPGTSGHHTTNTPQRSDTQARSAWDCTLQQALSGSPKKCAAKAKHPMIGVDVSHWQHSDASGGKLGPKINFNQVRKAGPQFVMIKATEGTTYVDPWFHADYPQITKAKLGVTPYHYWSTGSSATAQARFFISHLHKAGYTGHRVGELPPMLDLEACPQTNSVASIRAFMDKVEKEFGRRPILYTSKYMYESCIGSATGLGKYPLEVADYSASSPRMPVGWSSWKLWQYTETARVDGIPQLTDLERVHP